METYYQHMTMNERLEKAGIRTIGAWISLGRNGEGHYTLDGETIGAKLEYNGKVIFRPMAQNCVAVVKREFGLDI